MLAKKKNQTIKKFVNDSNSLEFEVKRTLLKNIWKAQKNVCIFVYIREQTTTLMMKKEEKDEIKKNMWKRHNLILIWYVCVLIPHQSFIFLHHLRLIRVLPTTTTISSTSASHSFISFIVVVFRVQSDFQKKKREKCSPHAFKDYSHRSVVSLHIHYTPKRQNGNWAC